MTANRSKAVAPSEPSTSVIPHRTMRHLVLDIRKAFQRTVDAHERFKAERLKLAHDLCEARARVEAGEEGDIDWWKWFEKNFPQSRSDAERLLAIAGAADPQAAYDAAKARNAVHNQAYRERQRQASISREMERPLQAPIPTSGGQEEVLPPDPGEEDLIDQIIDLFTRLSRNAQVRCAVRQRKVMRGDT